MSDGNKSSDTLENDDVNVDHPLMNGATRPTSAPTEPSANRNTSDVKGELAKAPELNIEGDPDEEGDADEEEEENKADERGAWGGQLEFIFTCIGYAVGLGNVWRFPYLCYKNGGGAFLVPYVLMLAFCGLPLFFMELAFGQFASLGPITIWKVNPLFKGLGYAMVAVSWLIAVYYNVVISHVLFYLFASFASITTSLPWITCGNAWNTNDCITPTYSDGNSTNVTEHHFNPFNHTRNGTGSPKTPAEEYYNNYVLEMSDGMDNPGPVSWKLALCLLLAWIIVLICLIRGVQSLGKVVYFTAIFPYIMLTILLIRGATLPGAWKGIEFYLKPDFSRLGDSRVWSDAATQIFYSLSACSGGLVAMASYNKFNNNCLRDALLVSTINCGTSIYAGFVIFSILGFMAAEKGVEVSEVAAGGPGLAFVVYPEAISRMPAPQLWAIFFFFMMATLGFGSQFSIVECVLSAFTDEFAKYLRGKWQSILFRTSVIFGTFLLGLPMVTRSGIYLLNLVDYSVSGFPLLIVGLLECIALNWIYRFDVFATDISMMIGKRPNIYWKACWKFITPVLISVTILFNIIFYKPPTLDDYHYPEWAKSLGWLISLFPILLIPGYFMYKYCMEGGFYLMREAVRPEVEWGPAMPHHRTGTYQGDLELGAHADFSLAFGQGLSIKLNSEMPSRVGSRTGLNLIRAALGGSRLSLRVSDAQAGFCPSIPGSACGSRTTLNVQTGQFDTRLSKVHSGSIHSLQDRAAADRAESRV